MFPCFHNSHQLQSHHFHSIAAASAEKKFSFNYRNKKKKRMTLLKHSTLPFSRFSLDLASPPRQKRKERIIFPFIEKAARRVWSENIRMFTVSSGRRRSRELLNNSTSVFSLSLGVCVWPECNGNASVLSVFKAWCKRVFIIEERKETVTTSIRQLGEKCIYWMSAI